ncbi:MAG: hypothetical protein ICPDIFCJ_00542 [Sodalis sp. Ppy]|nr:hypothetical protein [Sodalis sp. Ppy]
MKQLLNFLSLVVLFIVCKLYNIYCVSRALIIVSLFILVCYLVALPQIRKSRNNYL